MSIDQTTLLPARRSGGLSREEHLFVTVAWHPDPTRVGDRVTLEHAVEVGRSSPDFGHRPLADPHLSRKPVCIEPAGQRVRIRPHPRGSSVRVNGEPCPTEPIEVGGGIVVELAERVVLVVHRGRVEAPPGLELVGRGFDAVREQILQVADLDVSVLIRGETGTGKERVAQALHHRSGRAGRPFVAVNLAALPESTAVAELFGHARGAFTGADRAREGLFGRADRGTLFLDEVGEASAEVQVALLRVLETGEVQRLGADRPTRVDVRVLAATDADLESAVEQGLFREPLLHRLAGFEIALPPLRERREDIGPLLLHFLKAELDALGERHRLDLAAPAAEPWVPVPLAARLIRADWSGNVRQLRNAARQLVIASRGHPHVVQTAAIERLLDSGHPGVTASTPAVSPEDGVPDDEAMHAALRAAAYRPSVAAAALGISRTTLYAWMARTPGVRKAKDLTAEDLDRARAEVGEDRRAMARRLEVSARGLALRIAELGWP